VHGNRNWAQIVKRNALDAHSFQSIRALKLGSWMSRATNSHRLPATCRSERGHQVGCPPQKLKLRCVSAGSDDAGRRDGCGQRRDERLVRRRTNTYSRWKVAVTTMKKSQASTAPAWLWRNTTHDWADRPPAGSRSWRHVATHRTRRHRETRLHAKLRRDALLTPCAVVRGHFRDESLYFNRNAGSPTLAW